MSDEYLWNREGPVDRDVEALEQLLARYAVHRRSDVRPPVAPAAVDAAPVLPGWSSTLAAAAAVGLLALGVAWMGPAEPTGSGRHAQGWALVPLTGAPTVEARPLQAPLTVSPGRWIETDDVSSARLDVGEAGRVVIAPRSRVRVTRADATAQHLHLASGTLDAMIWAPPGQVVVTTPVATAVDLGCAYTLTLDEAGRGHLRVTSGWVGLIDADAREAFVPAGARVGLHAEAGPGIPVLVSATPDLTSAVEAFETTHHAGSRRAALDAILAHASPGDALTLWHLLSRVDAADRARVFDALAARLAPPDDVTRNGIVAGNRAMLDAWWETLGYGSRDWWRLWVRDWRRVR